MFRPSQLVTNAHGAPPPARTTRRGPPSLGAIRRSRRGTRAYGARPRSVLPVTTGHKTPAGPHPARPARQNGSSEPTRPEPQRVPPVTTGHKRPRGPRPGAFCPSQRVTNAHGALTQACTASHDGSQRRTGPQLQRVPPVSTRYTCPRGPRPSAFCPSQRVTRAHRALAPARSARHNGHIFTWGASPSAFRPSQRATHAHGAPTAGDSARLDRSNMPTGPQPQGVLLGTASQNAHGAFASVDPARHNG